MEQHFTRQASSRARSWRTARALGAVSLLVLVAAPSATSDDGLPPGANGIKGAVISTGLGSAAPAKQFFRVPQTRLWADVAVAGLDAKVATFAVSPPGAPHPYGYFPPIPVRTLAFGVIPAEATISLAQLRQDIKDVDLDTTRPDSDGPATEDVPVPWTLTGPALSTGEHTLIGEADLRITSLSLDGVRVAIGRNCRTSTPATVTLHGQSGYIPTTGGNLAGTVDVPAFTGCGTNGEDLSPLITSMVSGRGNSLQIRQSEIASAKPEPGNIPDPFPLPER